MSVRSLTEYCTLNMGQSPDSKTYNTQGNGLPFYQGNADFGETHPITRVWCSAPVKVAEEGDILISVRAPIGAMNMAVERCCIGRGLAALTPIRNKCSKQFLYYALQSKVDSLIAQGTGSTFKAISKKVLEATRIPAYSTIEQEQIAETIGHVDSTIAARRKQLALLDQLSKSRFIELFGSMHESKRYPCVPVKNLAEVISGGTPSRKNSTYWDEGTIPWVKTTELKNNLITEVEEYITEAGLAESSAKLVPAGTVLVAMYGQEKTRGMTAYLGIEASTNQACACILPSEKIDSMFLWKYLELSYEKLRSLAQGAGQHNLNGNMIKDFPVLIPPIDMQKSYVSFVIQVDKSKLAVQQGLQELETLKKSLMQQYFG